MKMHHERAKQETGKMNVFSVRWASSMLHDSLIMVLA